jgi:hypothetical protein
MFAAGFIVEGIQDGEEAFAGNAEDAFNAMGQECIDDQACARGRKDVGGRDSRCHAMKSPKRFRADGNGQGIS